MEDDARPCSGIVPGYNTARYLPQRLSSLCTQTLHAIEILCTMTAPPMPPRREFCARDARVRLISQPNAGVWEARKNGMRHARGEYIGFADNDDYVAGDFYAGLYTAACREQADIAVTCAIFPFGDAGTVFPPKSRPISAEKSLPRLRNETD